MARGVGALGAALLLLFAATCGGARADADERPNVLLIVTDDQRWDELTYMDNLRKYMSAEGLSFSNAYDSYPLCCPARTTLLTGQYAHNHGVIDNYSYDKLNGETTLAHALRREGYTTQYVGKYLNGYEMGVAGTLPSGWDAFISPSRESVYSYLNFTVNENGRLYNVSNVYQADWTRDTTLARLDALKAGRRKPFFFTVGFVGPHAGFEHGHWVSENGAVVPVPAPQDEGKFAGKSLPRRPNFNEADYSDKRSRWRRPLSAQQIKGLSTLWQRRQETLQSVDRAIGAIFERLQSNGQLDNTVVIFTSDNGFLIGEHRFPQGKNVLYQESVRAPLIFRGPNIPRHVTRDEYVSHIDVGPTILALAQATALAPPDGRSLLPLLRCNNCPSAFWPRKYLLVEANALADNLLLTLQYSYIENSDGVPELYDLIHDPYQLRNSTRIVSPQQLQFLRAKLSQLKRCKASGCRSADQLDTV